GFGVVGPTRAARLTLRRPGRRPQQRRTSVRSFSGVLSVRKGAVVGWPRVLKYHVDAPCDIPWPGIAFSLPDPLRPSKIPVRRTTGSGGRIGPSRARGGGGLMMVSGTWRVGGLVLVLAASVRGDDRAEVQHLAARALRAAGGTEQLGRIRSVDYE